MVVYSILMVHMLILMLPGNAFYEVGLFSMQILGNS